MALNLVNFQKWIQVLFMISLFVKCQNIFHGKKAFSSVLTRTMQGLDLTIKPDQKYKKS